MSPRTARAVDDMPAGHARDEQVRVNADDLQRRGETELGDGGRINPKAFEPDREILYQIVHNQLEVSGALPEYDYCWVCTRADGVMVNAKQSIRVRDADGFMRPIWEVVRGADMPEAKECMDVTGVRRLGDVILMRIRKDHHALLRRANRQKQKDQVEAAHGTFLAMGEEAQRRGQGIVTRVDTTLADPRVQAYARRAAAQGIAREEFTRMLQDGAIPGLRPGEDKELAEQARQQTAERSHARDARWSGR